MGRWTCDKEVALLLPVPHHNLNFGSRAFRISASQEFGTPYQLPSSVHDCKSLSCF